MKKLEISQPEKAWEKQGVLKVFMQCALEPGVVQAEIVNPPVISLSNSPAPHIEVNDTRGKKHKRAQSSTRLGNPLGYRDDLMHQGPVRR